jgi:ribosomal protein S24E
MATAKGHLDQSRQNVRSTKTKTNNDQPTIEIIETQEPNNQTTNQASATIEETGKVYTDQTGAFPTKSSNGKKYMLVMYHYDTNAILVEPLKTRHGNEILRGYQKLYTHLTNRGFKPTTHWLDNEASTTLKEFNTSEQVDYQLVPPQVHRRNSAERAIRTWKNHLILGICSTDTNFPLHLWD